MNELKPHFSVFLFSTSIFGYGIAFEILRMIMAGHSGFTFFGATFGSVCGFLYLATAALISKFTKSKKNLPAEIASRSVTDFGSVKYFRAVPGEGMLYFTAAGLFFKPGQTNFFNPMVDARWEQVSRVVEFRIFNRFPVGITIEMNNGDQHHFLANNHQQWLTLLNQVHDQQVQKISA